MPCAWGAKKRKSQLTSKTSIRRRTSTERNPAGPLADRPEARATTSLTRPIFVGNSHYEIQMIPLRRNTSFLELLLITIAMSVSMCAQQPIPCWDHQLKGDSQYPEVDSKCV